MPRPTDTFGEIPALVVGAGPAGLAAAIELARHDVPVLLVERRTVLSSHPRATVLSLRSMELMRGWGLEKEVRDRSADVDWRILEAETLLDVASGAAVPTGYPSPAQSRVLSPVEPACVAQDDVEPLLLAQLRDRPSARVELGWELAGVRVGPAGARAALRHVGTGATRTAQARYVVAADGARSAVRRALGLALHGEEDVMTGVTTLVHAPLWDVVGPHRHVLYSVTRAESPSIFLPTGASDRWLFASRTDGAAALGERRTASSSASAPACRGCRSPSGGPGAGPRRRRSPSGSGRARCSWPATRRTA